MRILTKKQKHVAGAQAQNEQHVLQQLAQRVQYAEKFWAKSCKDVLDTLGSSEKGLSSAEAASRLKKYGRNELTRKRLNPFSVLLNQFKSPLVIILIITSIVSIFLGSNVNAAIILAMVLLSALLGFFNEYKAEKTIEDLLRKFKYNAKVFRNGIEEEIDTRDLVPGDVIALSMGDIVPADIRLIETKDLQINEAALTGESYPVHKIDDPLMVKEPLLSQLKNCAFMGTVVAHGYAKGVVIQTGMSTEFGGISASLVEERPETEFQKGIKDFGNLLVRITILLSAFIFLVNGMLKGDFLSALLFSLAVAVGLVPELLPAIVSINLSNGAGKMLKKGVIVKRLIAIEDFGDMDILCTDKTGTLTEGDITLRAHYNLQGKSDERILHYAVFSSHVTAHRQKIFGNPIDVAVVKHAINSGAHTDPEHKRIAEFPFDFERRRSSSVVRIGKKYILVSKGAPEEMLAICNNVEMDGKVTSIKGHVRALSKQFIELAAKGNRVVAVAGKELDKKKTYTVGDENDLTLLGYIIFFDPPKATAKAAIQRLNSLNIELKILTGDNEHVTESICKEVGLPIKGIMTGPKLARLAGKELSKAVENSTIFAKLTPEQKVTIIRLLRDDGHVVGFIGDGINDAPAMHASDAGISVETGVDVAKDAADIVLLRKSLNVLADGVVEGRHIFGNTMKYVLMALSSNFGNMFSVAGASIFLPFLPMLPVQILLTNFIYDISELTIPTDNVDEEYIKKPKKWDVHFINRYMVFFGLISSLFDFITFGILWLVLNASPELFRTGWFIESLSTEVAVIFLIRTRRPFFQSRPGLLLALASLLAIAIAFILPFSPIGALFGFVAPPTPFVVAVGVIILVYLALVELGKHYFYSRYAEHA